MLLVARRLACQFILYMDCISSRKEIYYYYSVHLLHIQKCLLHIMKNTLLRAGQNHFGMTALQFYLSLVCLYIMVNV